MITILVGLGIQNIGMKEVDNNPVVSRLFSGNGDLIMFRPERDLHPHKVVEKIVHDRIWQYGIPGKNLVMTTHSPDIVNYLGELVYAKVIHIGQIKVFVLSEDNSKIEHESSFVEEGFLDNWPYGFFLPKLDFIKDALKRELEATK